MAPLTTLLEIFGLTTKRRLKRAVAKRTTCRTNWKRCVWNWKPMSYKMRQRVLPPQTAWKRCPPNANKDLDESNKKMYRDLETAVRRVIPLRNQIEEL